MPGYYATHVAWCSIHVCSFNVTVCVPTSRFISSSRLDFSHWIRKHVSNLDISEKNGESYTKQHKPLLLLVILILFIDSRAKQWILKCRLPHWKEIENVFTGVICFGEMCVWYFGFFSSKYTNKIYIFYLQFVLVLSLT